MKNYKDCEQVFIGSSDIASLTLRSPMEVTTLNFGKDGDYQAYVVDREAKIGDHYSKVYECEDWLKIYDDNELVREFKSDTIEVYRAGEMGCIIRLS